MIEKAKTRKLKILEDIDETKKKGMILPIDEADDPEYIEELIKLRKAKWPDEDKSITEKQENNSDNTTPVEKKEVDTDSVMTEEQETIVPKVEEIKKEETKKREDKPKKKEDKYNDIDKVMKSIEDLDKTDTEDRNKIIHDIMKLDIISQDTCVKSLAKKCGTTAKSVKAVMDSFAKEKKDNVIDEYRLVKWKFGIKFMIPNFQQKNPPEIELADFNEICKQKCNSYDIEHKTTSIDYRFCVNYKKEHKYCKSNAELKNILSEAKRTPGYSILINSTVEEKFIECVNELEDTEKNLTNAFGFYNGLYHDYPEYDAYTIITCNQGSKKTKKYEDVTPSNSYIDFIELKIDIDKVTKCIDILNNNYCPDEEKICNKEILCFSIASSLKIELYYNDINLHPICIVIGKPGTGKSTSCRLFICNLYNSPELHLSDFQGVSGSRIKRRNPDIFLLYTDELITLGKLTNDIKRSTTTIGFTITRGNKNQDITEQTIYNNFIGSTNNYSLDEDQNFKTKHIFIKHTGRKKEKKEASEIKYLEDNIIHLGKYIYSKYKEYDFSKIIVEIKEKYKHSVKDARDLDKIVYIKLGEYILDDIGIWKSHNIPVETILDSEIDDISDVKDTISMGIQHIITNYNHKDITTGNIYTVNRILNDKYINKNISTELDSKGIHISYTFSHVILSRNFITKLNEYLNINRCKMRVKTLKQLAEILQKESDYKNYNYITDINDKDKEKSMTLGLQIMSRETLNEEQIVNNKDKSQMTIDTLDE